MDTILKISTIYQKFKGTYFKGSTHTLNLEEAPVKWNSAKLPIVKCLSLVLYIR